MLQPKKSTGTEKTVNKVSKTARKVSQGVALGKILSYVPGVEEVYDVGNILKGLAEGDYKKIAANTIGALIPGVSGKAFESVAEDWLPPTPQIEKEKMKSNLSTSPADRMKYLEKYGPGYLNNPEFIKDQNLDKTSSQGNMKKSITSRKKYGSGTGAGGIDPNHYIISPAEALNDYNIMLGKVEAESMSNPMLPVVSALSGLMQTGIGVATTAANNKLASQPQPATAAFGNSGVNKDIEMEGGEVIETPQGQVAELEGPSHEQGGIPMEVGGDVPAGTKVYSDRLMLGGKTLAERKAIRETRIANLQKNLEKNNTDIGIKNAVSRKISAIELEESRDLQFQEQVNNVQMMADSMMKAFGTGAGGVQKMGKGGVVGDPPAYGKGSDGQYYTANTFKLPFNYWSAKLQETEGDKYRVRSLDNVDDRKEFQRFFYKDNQGKDLSGQKIPYTDKDSGVSFIQNYTIDGILGQTAMAQSVQGVGTDYANYMDADGNLFPNTQEAIKNKVPVTLANNPNLNFDALKNFKIGDGINDNASLSYGDPYAKNGVNFEMPTETIMTPVTAYGQGVNTEETKKEPSKFAKALEGNMPTVGDLTKLLGNYLGMTSGIKTAGEQRSTDVTHTNVYEHAGDQAQTYLEKAQSSVEGQEAQAISRATATARGGKRSGRNSARGINQARGMDWMYDNALNDTVAEISAKTAAQMAGLFEKQGELSLNADQLKGKGQFDADIANEAAKDAYYTALGLGRKDLATGVQQTGKDLNDMTEADMIENLMKNYGKYVTLDSNGNMTKKNK